MSAPVLSADFPKAFHVLTKPIGPICNLDCKYCFYLKKEGLYPHEKSWRMTDETLENYVRQYIAAQQMNEIHFAWQGGEPTLMGVKFFQRVVELQKKYARPGMRIHNAFQTNGVLLDDEWGRFLAENHFLVGVSLDGPPEWTDAYRVDKQGRPTTERIVRGIKVLQRHKVEFNILCVLNRKNAEQPLAVYRFFKSLGVDFVQFIPAVEQVGLGSVSDFSVTGEQYGRFLCDIFDEWVRKDVGRVFVQIFEVALEAWVGSRPSLCIFNETCGLALALEHNGDVYSCDHFVNPENFLGNIREKSLTEMVVSPVQVKFGHDKRDALPRYCRECAVRFVCNGGCPKDRFLRTPDGEPGLNYLCAGYKRFFAHIDGPMRQMAALWKAGENPALIMQILADKDQKLAGRPMRQRSNTRIRPR